MSNVNQFGNWWDNTIAQNILSKKYFHDIELQLMQEKGFDIAFEAFVNRVSSIFSTKELRKFVKDSIINGDFIFAGRTLYGAGNRGKSKTSLSNCYILPSPEDNIESIFSVAGDMAKIFSRGGGCGINISNLRPRNSTVHNASKASTGAVSFMDVYNQVGEVIAQNGRRGATLIGLSCTHPDLEEFLTIKQNNNRIQKANISILFNNEFMQAVKDGKLYQLEFNVKDTGEKITKVINAREFFEKFAESQWDWAEPASLFIDRIQSWNMLSGYPEDEYKIEVTNPCAEYAGNAYNSCNLASINLYNFVDNPFTNDSRFAYERFIKTVRQAVKAMDEVLDYGYDMQPLDQNRKCIDDWRSIGLGVFGIADMLVAMSIKYGSSESIGVIDNIFSILQYAAFESSCELAETKGSFGKYDFYKVSKSKFLQEHLFNQEYPDSFKKLKESGLRNGTLLAIAPTGSISMLYRESGGVEPYYQVSYDRTTHELEKQGKSFRINMLAVEHLLKFNNIDPNSITGDEVKEKFPFVVDTYDINALDRIEMQSTMQHYVDNAISSTLNLPERTTPKDIFDIYMYAWEKGCKGITVFRDNCERISILGKDHGNSTAKINSNNLENVQNKQSDNLENVQESSSAEKTAHFTEKSLEKCANSKTKNLEKCGNDTTKSLEKCGKVKLNSLSPLKRKHIKVLEGKTYVFRTACVPKFYVTVNHLDGEVFEVFAGIANGCQANISTITRLTSYALRLGGKVEDIVEELNSAICPACTTLRQRGDTTVNKSCASCFADAITAMYDELQGKKQTVVEEVSAPPEELKMVKVAEVDISSKGKMQCPECGKYTLIPDGKCAYCNNCGFSKCD